MNLLSFSSDLIHCTNEMNVNIPQLADSLFERTTNTSWVVVFKSLITTHHLMVYGNEVRHTTFRLSSNNTRNWWNSKFTEGYLSINVLLINTLVVFYLFFPLMQRFVQYLASRNTLFNLSNFLDKSGLQGTPTPSHTYLMHHLKDLFDRNDVSTAFFFS